MNQEVNDYFAEFRFPKFPIKSLRWMVLGIFGLLFLFTFFYSVATEEVGVIQRFGAYNRTVPSGLHIKMPFGIETVRKISVERQFKEEFGFRTKEAGIRTVYDPKSFREEKLMLTGDLNASDVEWIVQYRIADPYKFLFKVRNATQTFRDINEALMREVVGDRSVNEVLTIGRVEISNEVARRLQALCDEYETGIKVDQIVLQDVMPPEPVKPAFNEVNEAQQEREKMINQARSEYNKVIPKAKGDAARIIEEAKGYAIERVNQSRGEANKFNAVFKEYLKAPEVTQQRLYLETMNEVLSKVGRKIITDKETTGILPLFQMEKTGKEGKKND